VAEDLVRNAIAAFSSREAFKDVQSLGQDSDELKSFEFETRHCQQSRRRNQKRTKTSSILHRSLPNDVLLDMVAIPGGTFMMGSPAPKDMTLKNPT
jgi:formylglycine-generating enzyme required for sulfatase activity